MEAVILFGSYEDVEKARKVLEGKNYMVPFWEGFDRRFRLDACTGKTVVENSCRDALTNVQHGVMVFFREPGGLCVTVRGLARQIGKTLADLGIPAGSFEEASSRQ